MTTIYHKNLYIRFNKQLTCLCQPYWPERYRFDSRDYQLLFDYIVSVYPEELGLNMLKLDSPYPGDKTVTSLKLQGVTRAYSIKRLYMNYKGSSSNYPKQAIEDN